MIATENFEKLEIQSINELRAWLLTNYNNEKSIWLVSYLKSEHNKYVSRWDVLDELICFGWIDGIRRKLDDKRTMQLISKRRVEHWAKSYKTRAAHLMEMNRMHESGIKSIEISKEKGLWDFMEDVDNLIIPDDLDSELEKWEGAKEFFISINPSSKRFALRWLKLAKTDITRKKRIVKLAQLSSKGEKLPGS